MLIRGKCIRMGQQQITANTMGVHAYMDGAYATDIAATHTGNGYWVSFSDGSIYGFGDATPSYTPSSVYCKSPTTPDQPRAKVSVPVSCNEPYWLRDPLRCSSAYSYSRRCTSIVKHPTKMGFWATDGSGQVFPYGACEFSGNNYRTYNQGGSNEFKLNPSEWAVTIECTQSGNGYWLMFNSGHIAALC